MLAVIAFTAVLATALVGVRIAAVAIGRGPVREAEVGGLHAQLGAAQWLVDQMHDSQGQVYSMPASMMPDIPDQGFLRLNVEVNLRNPGGNTQHFRVQEFELRDADGAAWSPVAGRTTDFILDPGQALDVVLNFDVPARVAGLRLVWTRATADVIMPVPSPDPELIAKAEEHVH
ncbi:MAG: hypothetical protein D6791_13810 [Chloroflexi bacterium]|nr:MAG: hypothetical protein D6791_13810 [Chloroflexota bacterium]